MNIIFLQYYGDLMIALAQDKTYKFDWIYPSINEMADKSNETATSYCQQE